MSRNYDNWERLVAAVIKREQLWELFHAQSRSPSILSDASDFDSISGSSPPYNPGLVFVSDFDPVFDLQDLWGASPQILGRGTFGIVYAAKMDNIGTTVGVKRLKIVNISEQDFKTHMGMMGDVKHENVAPLRAYYYSQDEKFMIYDYYNGGSVSALLHGKTGENRAHVEWKTRLRIARGAARGISYIHAQNGGDLVHGNIKSSNVFLNTQRYGIVSDLGLASMIPTKFSKSAKCYAPEVEHSQNVSQASDVYSFGILLLELLTRRSPEPALGHKAVDLVKLVNSASRKEWKTKVFDGDLLFNAGMRDEIVRLLEIGISCVAKSPKKRPNMSSVAEMIEDIGMMSIDVVSLLHRQDLLFASDKVLGHGTFGTSHKAILEDGNVISVKRLKDVVVTNEEFQQHMEVTGKMGHENVAELKAYYYSREEKLLVYDYYGQGSLSAALHGSGSSGRRHLDSIMRLKIAISAAKGIAHIHTTNDQKLVHGNIRASNIFINEQQFGIVSDVGLGKLVSPTKSFVTRNTGYCAPEVTDNREASQASDVFSFGVVLLELLTGARPGMMFKRELTSLLSWIQGFARDRLATSMFDSEIWRSGEVDKKMMQIAMDCVDHTPERRPKMVNVVKMLEDIQMKFFEEI